MKVLLVDWVKCMLTPVVNLYRHVMHDGDRTSDMNWLILFIMTGATVWFLFQYDIGARYVASASSEVCTTMIAFLIVNALLCGMIKNADEPQTLTAGLNALVGFCGTFIKYFIWFCRDFDGNGDPVLSFPGWDVVLIGGLVTYMYVTFISTASDRW